MKTVTISTSSFLFRYLSFIKFHPSVHKLPDNTCALRRDLIVYTILAVLTLPFMLLFHLLLAILDETGNDEQVLLYVFTGLLQSLSLAMGVGMLPGSNFFLAYGAGLATLVTGATILICSFIVFVKLGIFIVKQIRELNYARRALHPDRVSKPSIIGELWRSFKDKVCFRIDYN